MEYSALNRRVGETVRKHFRAREYVEYGRKLTHRGNMLTAGVYLFKTDFVRNKFLKIITECMRARVCMCVHTYVHSSYYAMFTFARQCSNVTRTTIAVHNISVLWFVLRRGCR